MKRKGILLVDDDLDLLKLLAKRCRKLGLEAHTAHNALQAVSLLEKKKPDLICLSDSVPGGNGMKLCQMVLASPDDVSCPVIVLTEKKKNVAPRRSDDMCVYSVHKRPHVWKYLEPVIYELIDIQPLGRRTTGEERDGCQMPGASG